MKQPTNKQISQPPIHTTTHPPTQRTN